MKLKSLFVESMLNGQTAEILTAVGEALTEVQERNRVNSELTEEQAAEKNKPFNEAAVLVYQARNVF